jgi:RNA polymerase sigma-70 factor (ECF subfamily)
VAQNKGDAAKTEDAKQPAPNRLSYNDGSGEAKRSIAGSGEMLSFTLPGEDARVAGIRIHGSRYGLPQPPKEDFMIYFLNADMTDTVATKTAPYSRLKRGDQQWVEIKFPKPIEVPKEFWVCLDFRAAQTKGIYLSVDDSTDGSHSKVGLPGMEIKPADVGGDWMIEVVLAK